MNTNKIFITAILTVLALMTSCIGKWQNPNDTIAAEELNIRDLLIIPTIYDSAGVILEGKIWDLEFINDEKNPDKVYSMFKLADKDGNFVYVTSADPSAPLANGNKVKVLGIHRMLPGNDANLVTYLIEAKRVTQ